MKLLVSLFGVTAVSMMAVPLGVAAAVLPSSLAGPALPSGSPTAPPGPAALPLDAAALYLRAAAACPGLSWAVLAAIATVESGNGSSQLAGVHSGHNPAGAEGPMQFEPATFAAYARPVPPGGADPPSPYDPVDSAYAAARMLCADGAATPSGLPSALYDYNHSAAYVSEVLNLAETDQAGPTGPTGPTGPVSPATPTTPALLAAEWAVAQIGTPYVWGGETPGVGFDCSGLVQAAYAAAAVSLPRVAQAQFDAGPRLPAGAALHAGDLVFFGTGPTSVEHVGLVIQPGVMVDAPHRGADVREEPFPSTVGAGWGAEMYLGASRPAE